MLYPLNYIPRSYTLDTQNTLTIQGLKFQDSCNSLIINVTEFQKLNLQQQLMLIVDIQKVLDAV